MCNTLIVHGQTSAQAAQDYDLTSFSYIERYDYGFQFLCTKDRAYINNAFLLYRDCIMNLVTKTFCDAMVLINCIP